MYFESDDKLFLYKIAFGKPPLPLPNTRALDISGESKTEVCRIWGTAMMSCEAPLPCQKGVGLRVKSGKGCFHVMERQSGTRLADLLPALVSIGDRFLQSAVPPSLPRT